MQANPGLQAPQLQQGPSPVPTMAPAPAPLLRPAIPGARPGGRGPPRLGLAIPPSLSVKPVGNPGAPPARAAPPQLKLATPMGSSTIPHEQPAGRPVAQGYSASGASDSSAAHSRSGSFGPESNPTSADTRYSNVSFMGAQRPHGTPDPVSAVGSLYSNASEGGVGMERENSLHGLEAFDQLTLEKARTLDVEDLDDDGWRIAMMEKRVEELGPLGEGAGGAVTKAKLKGGKTVFALKV